MRFGKQPEKHETISTGKLVELTYTITDEKGVLLDSTNDLNPMRYVHGGNELFQEVQKALEGKTTGNSIKVKLKPGQAYGEHNPKNTMNLEIPLFDASAGIKKGMQFEIPTSEGLRLVTIISIDGNEVTVDLNHPLAGKSLQIEATVQTIRDANVQEKELAGLTIG